MKTQRRFTIKKREQARRFVEDRIQHFNGFYFLWQNASPEARRKASEWRKHKSSNFLKLCEAKYDFQKIMTEQRSCGDFYNFKINHIAIKDQTSRWGSCSSKGNLNFNYKIIYLRPALADYLIVHELCHLGELNHSKRFWELVFKTSPDYVKINKELRRTNVRLV